MLVARAHYVRTFLRSHPLLSLWFHNPADPFSTQLRLSALFASLFTSLAASSIFYAPARLATIESDLSVSFYSSVLMYFVNWGFSQLFIRCAE